jgi:hypothetical protein
MSFVYSDLEKGRMARDELCAWTAIHDVYDWVLCFTIRFLILEELIDSSCISATQPVSPFDVSRYLLIWSIQLPNASKSTSTNRISIHHTINSDASVTETFHQAREFSGFL